MIGDHTGGFFSCNRYDPSKHHENLTYTNDVGVLAQDTTASSIIAKDRFLSFFQSFETCHASLEAAETSLAEFCAQYGVISVGMMQTCDGVSLTTLYEDEKTSHYARHEEKVSSPRISTNNIHFVEDVDVHKCLSMDLVASVLSSDLLLHPKVSSLNISPAFCIDTNRVPPQFKSKLLRLACVVKIRSLLKLSLISIYYKLESNDTQLLRFQRDLLTKYVGKVVLYNDSDDRDPAATGFVRSLILFGLKFEEQIEATN